MMVSRVLWGNWENPRIQIKTEFLTQDKIKNIANMGNEVLSDMKNRVKWFRSENCVLDDMLMFYTGHEIRSAEKSERTFRNLFFLAGGCFIVFEAVARKYSNIFSLPYLKMIFRIGSVVGLLFTFCRYWGAYCHKKGIEQQVITVANERSKFYKGEKISSQVLHPREGEYWAQVHDQPFAEWLKATSPENFDASSEVDAFLKDPPFNLPNSASKKILDLCINTSPIVGSYHKFSESLEEKREVIFKKLGNYENEVMHKIRERAYEMADAVKTMKDGLSDERYDHYSDLAYWHLLPQHFQKALTRIKSGKEKTNIELQLYDKIQSFKTNVLRYQEGDYRYVDIPNLEDVKLQVPSLTELRDWFFDKEKKADWEKRALEAEPQKGTLDEYKNFIHRLSEKLETKSSDSNDVSSSSSDGSSEEEY